MKILILTVAGMSNRFSESLGYACHKCIYSEKGIEESLLYRMIYLDGGFDCYVIVGGFMYEELKSVLEENFKDIRDKITLIRNGHYSDYGSGYSLYLALERVREMDFNEVVFAEGDLYVDKESFQALCSTSGNIISCNREEIVASKAVAFYFDKNKGIHYVYDTGHDVIEIKEPFTGIFNSGQIWKFADPNYLRKTIDSMDREEWTGTNLALIQKYFGSLDRSQYNIITFKKWMNCNTVFDYRKIKEKEKHENAERKIKYIQGACI